MKINPDITLTSAARETQKVPAEDAIAVVREAQLAWPDGLEMKSYGSESLHSNALFKLALGWLRTQRPSYEWIPIFRDNDSNRNALARLPELLKQLNKLFKSELAADFSEAQISLLSEAHCVLIGYDKSSKSIVSFGSVRFSERGSLSSHGIDCRVIHAGLLIVAKSHAKAKLGTMMPTVIASYGHSFLSIFRREIIVLRINNKYLEAIMHRGGTVYRYDKLITPQDSKSKMAQAAMEWTHHNVFHLSHVPLEPGKPIPIQHRFTSDVTMENLKENEITYVSRMSSLVKFIVLVFMKSGRRSKTKL